MLPAEARLRRRSDFQQVTRRGRRLSGRRVAVTLLAAAATHGGRPAPARVGFVVPRQVGTAVARNRVRRRLRHLCAARLGALPPGSRLVVHVRPAATPAASPVLARDLDEALATLAGDGATS